MALIKKQSLVDTFYNTNTEEPVCGIFTSHKALNKVSKFFLLLLFSLIRISEMNVRSFLSIFFIFVKDVYKMFIFYSCFIQVKKKTICECDDPDCSGFIEEEEEESEVEHIKEQGERNIFDEIGGKTISEETTKPKINDKPLLSSIEFFDNRNNDSMAVKKKKKKKKETDNISLQDDNISKKRKSDGLSEGSSNAKKSKDFNNKYEMVFLEEGMKVEDDEDDDNLVENTKQSSSKVTLKPNDYISVNCVPKTGQGSIKKRIAHAPGNDVSSIKKQKKI